MVAPPWSFSEYREYEMPAQRTVGCDIDGRPCFVIHQFHLTQWVSDDDEEYYEAVVYSEQMLAWRLRDERWLIYRSVANGRCDAGRPPRGFYSFSETMPR